MAAELDMLEGYRDGYHDDRAVLPEQTNYTEAYRHGWMNGRDDRLRAPRASAAVLRQISDAILEAEERA